MTFSCNLINTTTRSSSQYGNNFNNGNLPTLAVVEGFGITEFSQRNFKQKWAKIFWKVCQVTVINKEERNLLIWVTRVFTNMNSRWAGLWMQALWGTVLGIQIDALSFPSPLQKCTTIWWMAPLVSLWYFYYMKYSVLNCRFSKYPRMFSFWNLTFSSHSNHISMLVRIFNG